jgi:uncharacterized FAD-dependent dehydrogenase
MNNNYDVGIVGTGMAGSFACYKLAQEKKNIKIIAFDIGRPPAKRRLQMEGFLGLLPNSDGKFYLSDIQRTAELIGSRKTNASFKALTNILGNITEIKHIKDKSPNISTEKKLKQAGYRVELNDFFQIFPRDIHLLSKLMCREFESTNNITFCFDNEVFSVSKQKNMFLIQTEHQEYRCRKLILCAGRTGWRWVSDLYSSFGIVEDNDSAQFGLRIEMPASNLKEFNKSNLSLQKEGKVEIGPFNWNGTVIPEDHIDLAISSFRSNENRWKTDKVSFQMISKITMPNEGYQQTDRIGQLTFILTNERILKERVSLFLNDRSKISSIPEYQLIKQDIRDLGKVIPDVLTKAYFHAPTILPLPPKIKISAHLETEIENLYVAGENAGVVGLLSAGMMGLQVAKEVLQ